MSFSFVQSNSHSQADEPFDLAFDGGNVGAGHLLVAAAKWNSNTATATVTDPNNGAWTPIGSPKIGAGALAVRSFQFFWVASSAAGATTVTFEAVGVTVAAALAIHEYSFTGASVSIDGTPVYTNHNSQTPTSDAVVTTVDADLLFAADLCSDSVSSAGAGYVMRENADFGNNGTEDDLDGGLAGSKTASFNVASVADNIIGLAAFTDGEATPVADTTTRRYQIRHSRMTSW